ncbi:MAG: hypothetical protein ACE141_18800 [Bryobacteraceae bacterium]
MAALTVDNLRDLPAEPGTIRPSSLALDNLQRVVNAAGDRCPLDGIMATAEGGAAAIWARTYAYADIECKNDGTIHALLMRGRNRIDDWEVTDVREAVERVKEHLYGATKSQCGGRRSRS